MDLKNEWMKKMWYAYALEYNSAIYKKGIFSFATVWMNLVDVIPNETSQQQ